MRNKTNESYIPQPRLVPLRTILGLVSMVARNGVVGTDYADSNRPSGIDRTVADNTLLMHKMT